jgi:hypothetical protein
MQKQMKEEPGLVFQFAKACWKKWGVMFKLKVKVLD